MVDPDTMSVVELYHVVIIYQIMHIRDNSPIKILALSFAFRYILHLELKLQSRGFLSSR